MRALVLPLLVLACPLAPALPAQAQTTGALAVEVAPDSVAPGNAEVVVRVANTGDAPVGGIGLTAQSPAGVGPAFDPATVPDLPPGTSFRTTMRLTGAPTTRPAHVVVIASGTSTAGSTVATATVELVKNEPVMTLTLVGNTRLTDASPAELVAEIANTADTEATVTVRATAEPHAVRLAREGADVSAAAAGKALIVTVPGRRTAVVQVEVTAGRPLRRGAAGLVVTATAVSVATPASAPVDAVASRELEVVLSADALPAAIGGLSVLVIPGLVGIWALLAVLTRDRRRMGLATPGAGSQIWDNKLWLLAALGVSLAASALYALFGFPGLLDTYTVGDIAWLTTACGAAGAASAALWVWLHRRQVPAVTPTTEPLDVLRAAAKEDDAVQRAVYASGAGLGLLVHSDRGAKVLTPPVAFTELDLGADVMRGDLGATVAKIEASSGGHLLRFQQVSGYVAGPRPATDALPAGQKKVPIVMYADEEDTG